MRNYFIIVALSLFMAFSNCSTHTYSKERLPINQMKYVVWDMLKADEYYIRLTANDTAKKFQYENLRVYDQIFRSYGITKGNFYASYKFYESNPNLFKELIDSVENVSKRERNLLLDTSKKNTQ